MNTAPLSSVLVWKDAWVETLVLKPAPRRLLRFLLLLMILVVVDDRND